MRRTQMFALSLFLFFASAVFAKDKALKVEPVLKPDNALLKKIEALGDNSSLHLPKPNIIEEIGDFAKGVHKMQKWGPGGRDYSAKMAWMSDRKRAFFCGANHGAPHRLNDAWEYDLASNTWVCLYNPDYNDHGKITDYDKKVLVLDKGWLRTKNGGPAHPAHTWWGLTYDPTIKAALWFNVWPPYRMPKKLVAIGKKKEDLYKGPPVWAFYPHTKKWEPLPTNKPWPKNQVGASLEYVPNLGVLWQYYNFTWNLDTQKKSWTLGSQSEFRAPRESILCYDSDRKIMIGYKGPNPRKNNVFYTFHMNLKDGKIGKWVLAEEASKDRGIGDDRRSLMYYDPVGKVALMYSKTEREIWAYNPDNKKWTKMVPKGGGPKSTRKKPTGYFDVARNVFVLVSADAVWCYRFKKKK